MRTEIIEFALEMEKRMKENDMSKRDSWKNCSISFLAGKLDEEIGELKAFQQYEKDENRKPLLLDTKELPDIANICMMLWSRRKEFA